MQRHPYRSKTLLYCIMRKTIIFLLALAGVIPASAQTALLPVQMKLVRDETAARHIVPRPINDAFSERFYTTYLNNLDEGHLFFTNADYKKLEAFRTSIDDEWNNAATTFFATSANLYKARLTAVKNMVTEICDKPFDFSLPESYHFADTAIALTDKQLAVRWYGLLKWETLQSLMSVAANSWQIKKPVVKAEVLAKEPEMRARTKTKYLNKIKAFLGTDSASDDLQSVYLNTFLLCFDPHSAFFDATARQNFQAELNTEGYYFGIALEENEKGETYISHIAPGSAAWKSGVLNKGDIPVQLKWEGSAAVELAGLEAAEISALLDQHTKEKMELVVRKVNGQQQTVVLQKQKAQNTDNMVKSYVLSGKQNIGYITLPSFYTEWEDRTGSRCAADVGKEILKLKKDSIAGLVLDLRFNGGGSVMEAVEMAGIFIDEGIVCQVRTKEAKIEALKDVARGVMYNGPLVILVNGQSASASELLAAALQDYHRAIIVGSPTYGKATGQEMVPLQDAAYAGAGGAGFLKITDIKIYRPTGKTAQRTGVQPDIILPDMYSSAEKEKDEPFALVSDTVAAYKYFKPLPALPVAGLQQQSAARIAGSAKFKEIKAAELAMAGRRMAGAVSLKWDDAEKAVKARAAFIGDNTSTQPGTFFSVRNNTADQNYAGARDDAELNSFWFRRLLSDAQLEEAFQILSDFIQLH